MYYTALRPEEAIDLRREENLISLPEHGWGELRLTHSQPRSGTRWTDSGEVRERRELKHATAATRAEKLGLPFTHWSLRKLAAWLAGNTGRPVRTGRERLRQLLHQRWISFQRTRTWQGMNPPTRTRTPSWTGSST